MSPFVKQKALFSHSVKYILFYLIFCDEVFRKWTVFADVCQIAQKSVETVHLQKFLQWVLLKINSYILYLISVTIDRNITALNIQAAQ